MSETILRTGRRACLAMEQTVAAARAATDTPVYLRDICDFQPKRRLDIKTADWERATHTQRYRP